MCSEIWSHSQSRVSATQIFGWVESGKALYEPLNYPDASRESRMIGQIDS
jgi:hypothetical protein